MEDILINGINLNELSLQINSIRQEASTMISDNVDIAQTLSKQIVESDSEEEIEQSAKLAYEALHKAHFISNVSGVPFSLPYNSSYNGYYDKDTISAMLDNSENKVLIKAFEKNQQLKDLLNLAYDMEYQSKHWDSSVC